MHQSWECPGKKSENIESNGNSEVQENPPPTCCNCGAIQVSSYKSCKNFPLKAKCKNSYADVAKNNEKAKYIEIKTTKKTEVAQLELKMEPPEPEQIYQLEEFQKLFSKN